MKPIQKQLRDTKRSLQKELNKQLDIIYSASAIILWRNGWRTLRIMRRFVTTMEIWTECQHYGPAKSMLQMLEEETGIELSLSGFDKSYHEIDYLDGSKWDGHTPTPYELIYMYQQERKWMPPLILASFCLSLHRDDHFGSERIERFISQVDALRSELGEDPDAYNRVMETETGITRAMIWGQLNREAS